MIRKILRLLLILFYVDSRNIIAFTMEPGEGNVHPYTQEIISSAQNIQRYGCRMEWLVRDYEKLKTKVAQADPRPDVMELQEEVLQLKQENKELKAKLDKLEGLTSTMQPNPFYRPEEPWPAEQNGLYPNPYYKPEQAPQVKQEPEDDDIEVIFIKVVSKDEKE